MEGGGFMRVWGSQVRGFASLEICSGLFSGLISNVHAERCQGSDSGLRGRRLHPKPEILQHHLSYSLNSLKGVT